MPSSTLQKIQELLNNEKACKVDENNKLKDAALDSLGYISFFVEFEHEFGVPKATIEALDYTQVTIGELVSIANGQCRDAASF